MEICTGLSGTIGLDIRAYSRLKEGFQGGAGCIEHLRNHCSFQEFSSSDDGLCRIHDPGLGWENGRGGCRIVRRHRTPNPLPVPALCSRHHQGAKGRVTVP
jgi:hypothetical protein